MAGAVFGVGEGGGDDGRSGAVLPQWAEGEVTKEAPWLGVGAHDGPHWGLSAEKKGAAVEQGQGPPPAGLHPTRNGRTEPDQGGGTGTARAHSCRGPWGWIGQLETRGRAAPRAIITMW